MDDKLWIDCSQIRSLGLILSSTSMERDRSSGTNEADLQAQIDMLATQYAAILDTYRAIQDNFATVATDIAKVKRALNIDVQPPPVSNLEG